jgi:hypothetical protein
VFQIRNVLILIRIRESVLRTTGLWIRICNTIIWGLLSHVTNQEFIYRYLTIFLVDTVLDYLAAVQ